MDADRGKKSLASSKLSSEDRVLRRLFKEEKKLGGGNSETNRRGEDDVEEEEEDKDEERDLEREVIESSESESEEDSEEEVDERRSSWKQKKYLSISGQVWSISCVRDEKGVSCGLRVMEGSSKSGDKGNDRGVVSIMVVLVVTVGCVDGLVGEHGSVA